MIKKEFFFKSLIIFLLNFFDTFSFKKLFKNNLNFSSANEYLKLNIQNKINIKIILELLKKQGSLFDSGNLIIFTFKTNTLLQLMEMNLLMMV